jgi:translation initiation factor IF-3
MHILVNEKIRTPQVRLISDTGEQLGIFSRNEALERAQNAGLDLVVINEQATPPVAKILNFGKFKYEQTKKQKEAQKKQRKLSQEIKELRMRPVTDQHDIGIRIKQAMQFIAEGDKVMFVVRFRGREVQQRDRGIEILTTILKKLSNVVVEKPIAIQGRDVTMLVAPDRQILEKIREEVIGKSK